MTDHPSALVSVPQAHIVWNEARNEGVIFVDQETTGWPLTAADDAYQASTGKSRHPGLGSALAEAFYEGYEDDEDRPVQVVPASIFAPAAPQAAGVVETVWRCAMTVACNIAIDEQNRTNDDDGPSDVLNAQGEIIRRLKGVLEIDRNYQSEVGAILAHGAEPFITAPSSESALTTREEAPAEAVDDVQQTISGETVCGFKVAAWQYLGPNHDAKFGHRYCEHWSTVGNHPKKVVRLFTEDQLRSALRAQPQAREDAQPVIAAGRTLADALRQYGFPVSGGAKAALSDHGSSEALELNEACVAFLAALQAEQGAK